MSNLILPYTANKQFNNDPRLIVEAQGHYYTADNGDQKFDSLSGLYTTGLGHCNPKIVEAIHKQSTKLDLVSPFQGGHPLMFQLAERLCEKLPKNLDRLMFTTSGSEAVETAIKFARAYWSKTGSPEKNIIVGRDKGYHGSNIGGMSAGGLLANKKHFGPGIETAHIRDTLFHANAFSRGQPEMGEFLAEDLLNVIDEHGPNRIAAVIIEPVATSGGVLPPPKGYLERIRDICDEYQILLIFDEVVTAFGRLGYWTAAERFGVDPDIMCLAKQITNGAVPMGACAFDQDLVTELLSGDQPDHLPDIFHGYTYAGHPLACAAAMATMDQLDSAITHVRTEEDTLASYIETLNVYPCVTDIRSIGYMFALQIEQGDQPGLRPYNIAMECWKQGMYVRYAGDTIQLAPPFYISTSQAIQMIGILGNALHRAIRDEGRN